MKTEDEIKNELSRIKTRKDYLVEFLRSCYKGSDTKQKAEKELISFQREIKALEWVLDGNLPF